jgi:hypothetical protein
LKVLGIYYKVKNRQNKEKRRNIEGGMYLVLKKKMAAEKVAAKG